MALVLAGCKLAASGKSNNSRFGSVTHRRPNVSIYDVIMFRYCFIFNPGDYSNDNSNYENMVA